MTLEGTCIAAQRTAVVCIVAGGYALVAANRSTCIARVGTFEIARISIALKVTIRTIAACAILAGTTGRS